MCFYPYRFNIPTIVNQLSNCIGLIAGERNEISLNLIVEPYVQNCKLKDLKMEDEIEAEKRCSMDDVNDNENKEEDWQIVAKNRNKVKGKKMHSDREKNQYEASQDDDEEDAEDAIIADTEGNFDMIVMLSTTYFDTARE